MEERLLKIRNGMLNKGCNLNHCLLEGEIVNFENAYEIVLPEGYREYLKQIGNGGEGPPEYGISRLGEVASDMSSFQKENWTSLDNASKEFPFTKPWIWDAEEISTEGTEDDVDYGSIYIGNDGCGMYWHLIVSGKETGNMWLFTGEGIAHTEPKLDFLSWLEVWLNGEEYWK